MSGYETLDDEEDSFVIEDLDSTDGSSSESEVEGFFKSQVYTPVVADGGKTTKVVEMPKNQSFLASYCIMINFMVGAGVLAMPRAFYEAGILYGAIMVGVFTSFVYLTCMWAVEGTARAQGMMRWMLMHTATTKVEQEQGSIQHTQLRVRSGRFKPRSGSVVSRSRSSSTASGAPLPAIGSGEDHFSFKILKRFVKRCVAGSVVWDNTIKFDFAEAASREGLGEKETEELARQKEEKLALLYGQEEGEDYMIDTNGTYGSVLAEAEQGGIQTNKRVPVMDGNGMRLRETQKWHHLYQYNNVLGLYLPKFVYLTYNLGLIVLLFLSLWALGAVFSLSLTQTIPITKMMSKNVTMQNLTHPCDDINNCVWEYRMFMVVLMVIAAILVLRGIEEMLTIQMILSAGRFLLIFILLIACGIVLGTGIGTDGKPTNNTARQLWSEGLGLEKVPISRASVHPRASGNSTHVYNKYFDMTGTGILLGSVMFSQLLDFSTTDVIQHVRHKSRNIPKLYVAGLSSTALMYASVGMMGALAFGEDTAPNINGNFANYEGTNSTGVNLAIRYYVSLFPAADMISMFPLVAISLANNVLAFIHGLAGSRGKGMTRTVIEVTVKLGCVLLPLTGSIFEPNLGVILQFLSFPAVFVAYLSPTLLCWSSQRACWKMGVSAKTPFLPQFLRSFGSMLFMGFMCLVMLGSQIYFVIIAPIMAYEAAKHDPSSNSSSAMY